MLFSNYPKSFIASTMLPKRFRLLALLGLLAACWPYLAAAQADVPARIARPTAVSPIAEMWARTAEYVYDDDPVLRPFADDLDQTVQRGSLKSFSHGIDDAVRTAQMHKVGVSNVLQLDELFKSVQGQHPATLNDLAKAITESLATNPERTADSTRRAKFTEFKTQLAMFAAVEAEAAAKLAAKHRATTDLLASSNIPAPAKTTIEPVTATSNWVWAALGMSALSLMGVFYLLGRPQPRAGVVASAEPVPSGRVSHQRNVKWTEIESYVQRELDKRLSAANPVKELAALTDPEPATPPVLATMPVAAVVAPTAAAGTLTHTQYVNQAPLNGTFPARALSDQPNMHSIFAIDFTEQNPNAGYFQVTGNQASHVRDHRSILEPVCSYVAYPQGSETRITTVEPGQVQRRADGAWHVTHRARIRFEA